MRIGVVSDTHNNLANVRRIVDLLNEAGVAKVVHTGDISQAKTLRELGGLRVPLFGVYGNNDERDALDEIADELGFELADPPLELFWGGRKIVVVHDPRDLNGLLEGHDVALHGHTHQRVVSQENGCLVFNPGECAGHLEGHNAIGIVDLDTLETEVLFF